MTMFRLGATSYIIPDGLFANARYLARQVQDMELVLFDLDDGTSNLPEPAEVEAMASLAEETGLTFTVHLPLDLHLDHHRGCDHPSLHKARRVIELTRPLAPWAYVAHLDGREIRTGAQPAALTAWQDDSVRALETVAAWIGDPQLLALENLESYPLDLIPTIAERLPISRCVDIGHLWLDGADPIPYLTQALPRTRVIHLHGIAENGRDHRSLAFTSSDRLVPVIAALEQARYPGVVTFEVFGQDDYTSSLAAWQAGLEHFRKNGKLV